MTLRWRRLAERQQQVSAAQGQPKTVRSEPFILLVEHEPDVRTLFVEILTQRGYRVASAGDFPVGTAMLRAMCPDLLITERLPNGDGRDLEKLARNMRHAVRQRE